ncbi:MAG: transketolase [Anaerolineae bacterium]|nr:transketolase [Anaerolineae bacterium]
MGLRAAHDWRGRSRISAGPSSLSSPGDIMNAHELRLKSIAYRKTILEIIHRGGAGHTAGSLSCVDILNVLYNHIMNITPENFNKINRDHYIQSKGHSVEALYTVLADQGFYSRDELLEGLNQNYSKFIGHPTRKVPGIEHNTGALGHGLSVSVGLALAGKLNGYTYRVFTLLGDGELAEGSSWEASMSAAHYKLDNLVVIVDRNTLQITGRTEEVNGLEPLADKFTAFGYAVRQIDGNNVEALADLLGTVPFEVGKPSLLLANTVKGKGVSYMEDQKAWHHKVPTDEQLATALAELDAARLELEGIR